MEDHSVANFDSRSPRGLDSGNPPVHEGSSAPLTTLGIHPMHSRNLLLRLLLLALLLPCAALHAQSPDPLAQEPAVAGTPENSAAVQRLQGEYLMLMGGPALRTWETMRYHNQQHDRWWANFLAATNVRTRQLVGLGVQPSSITWVVYRPAYQRRASEEGKPLTAYVQNLAAKRGVRLVWFNNQDELIQYINRGNNRGSNKIVSFDFFGHSNKHCFMFDYSSEVSGASSTWLHERDLKKLSRSAFHRKAFCKSWGCHTGESMTAKWRSALGVPLYGALGKTDYVPTGRGQLPVLSTAAGEWAR